MTPDGIRQHANEPSLDTDREHPRDGTRFPATGSLNQWLNQHQHVYVPGGLTVEGLDILSKTIVIHLRDLGESCSDLSLLESFPLALARLRGQRIAWTNHLACRQLGITSPEASYPIDSFLTPADHRTADVLLKRLRRSGEARVLAPVTLLGRDGKAVDVICWLARRNYQPDEVLVAWAPLCELIGRLEASTLGESPLPSMERFLSLGHFCWDLRAEQMTCSAGMQRLFFSQTGGPPSLSEFGRYVLDEDRPLVEQAVERASLTGKSYSVQYRLKHPSDGSLRTVREWGRVGLDRYHQPLRVRAVVQDITAQCRAEARLLEVQQQLRSLSADLQLTEERERRRIAEDLHDSICQILALSVRELKNLRDSAGPLGGALDRVVTQLNEAIGRTRHLVCDLSPTLLYDMGLQTATEALADQLLGQRGIEVRFVRNQEKLPLARSVEILLYRSLRELFCNILKHAHARRVDVLFQVHRPDLCIIVQDNGHGFDLSHLDRRGEACDGFGLLSIRERLAYIGGRFEIDSALGQGTRVRLTAPLDPKCDLKDYPDDHTNHLSG